MQTATNLRKNSVAHRIYSTLYQHEFMRTEKLAQKLDIEASKLSVQLTKLRRAGLIEYSGTRGDLRYKKHPLDKPLYPPQDDICHHKSKAKAEQSFASSTSIIDHIIASFKDLKIALTREQQAKSEAEIALEQINTVLKLKRK